MANKPRVLTLKLLGGVDIRKNDAPVTGFATQKALALFVYLAVTRQPHTRDHLDTLLWDNLDHLAARRALRYALWNLRQRLGPYLTVTPQNIAFNASAAAWADVAEFDALVANLESGATPTDQDLQNWRRAVELYRGEFLRGLHVRDAEEFETWMRFMRERMHQTMLRVLFRLSAHETARQNFERGIEYAKRLVELEAWNEDAQRALIQLYVARGDAGAALNQYETFRRILKTEFNAEPGAETRALVESAIALNAAPAQVRSPRKNNLPSRHTLFFGRSAEMKRIIAKFREPTCRLITLTGPGGIGKTRLALEAASKLTNAFADGVWFVPLAGVQAAPQDIARVLTRSTAHALGLGSDPGADLSRLLDAYLRPRKLLLLLDNLEQLIQPPSQDAAPDVSTTHPPLVAEWVRMLLDNAPNVHLLVTSRAPMNLQSEYVLRLDGLAVPPDDLAKAKTFPSVRLFLERAERTGAGAAAADLPDIARLCRFVEGMPLAIELVASHMNRASPQEMLVLVQTSLKQVTTAQPDVPARHHSLQIVFEHSWALLSPSEQTALAQASLFQQLFSRADAEHVIVLTDAAHADSPVNVAPTPVSGAIESLAEKSLVRRNGDTKKFRLHPLIRQFAFEKLSARAAQDTARRHAQYFLQNTAARLPRLLGQDTRAAMQEIKNELADLRAAWEWCVNAHDVEPLADALPAFTAFFEYAGLAGEGLALLEHAAQTLSDDSNAPQSLRLHLDLMRANLMLRLLRHTEAQTLAEHVLAHAEQPELVAQGRYVRAQTLARFPDTALEFDELERARDEARACKQTRLEALCLFRQGMVAMRAGNYRAAKTITLDALRIFGTVFDMRYMGGCFAMLGLIELTLGEIQDAIAVQTRAIETAERLGDEYLKAVTLHNLGLTLALQGQYEKAFASMTQSGQLYQKFGMSVHFAGSQAQAGLFLALLGQQEEARALLEEVLYVADPAKLPREIGWANRGLAVLAHRQGLLQDAVRFGRLALEPAARWNDANDRAEAEVTLAAALLELGMPDEAEAHYRAALALREQIGQTHLYPEAMVGLASVAWQRGERETARMWIDKIWCNPQLRLAAGLLEPFWVYWNGYQVMRALGDARALRLLETAQCVLTEYASHISDPHTRDQYLQVPWHRAILDATRPAPYLASFVVSHSPELNH